MRLTVVRGPSPAGPFDLADGTHTAGRAPECAICLPSKRVSRQHAVVEVSGTRVEVRDLDSHNGILAADGRRVARLALLPGGRVQIGDYILLYEAAAEDDIDLDGEPEGEDDLLLDEDTSDVPAVPPPPALPFAPRAGGFGAAAGRPAPDPTRSIVAPPSPPPRPTPAPARPAAPAPFPPAASPAAPAFPPPATPPPRPPAGPAAAPFPPPVVPFPPAGAPRPRGNPTIAPPQRTLASPGPEAPRSAASEAPRAAAPPPAPPPAPPAGPTARAALQEPAPPPPVLPFRPVGGFGGAKPSARPVPPDPSRSLVADPADVAPPPPWKPDVDDSAPPPRPAPVPPAPAPAARPAPPPPPKPTALPIPERAPVAPDGPAARGQGVSWIAQAALLVLTIVGLVLCAPFGGLLSQIRAASSGAEEVSLLRGEALAESLANRNAQPLADGRGLALDTAFLLERAGVRSALLCDTQGTVLAPPDKLRTSVAALPGYAEASHTGEVTTIEVEDGAWRIVTPVRAQMAGTGPRQIVGYAMIEYDPSVVADGAVNPVVSLVAGLFVVGMVVVLLVGGTWWLVLRPLAALREETELALLGDQHDVAAPVRLAQVEQLAHSINRVLARARATRR